MYKLLVMPLMVVLALGTITSAQNPNGSGKISEYTAEERSNIRVYQLANPSVVSITTSMVRYDRIFGLPIEGQGEGAGSGAVIDKQGHIITNNHVIEDADDITVTFANNNTYKAVVVGKDAEYDIAVLKVQAPQSELQPIKFGQSDELLVGQKAYVLGNPFGLGGSLTTGIISSLSRSLPSRVDGRAMTGMIQTDAAMNPGNSGGPLLSSEAEMIGMCIAIRSSVGQNSGVGFAIPINRVQRFLPELIKHGKVLRAYHGIVSVSETQNGLRIAKVSAGSPAEAAGLRGVREVMKTYRRGAVIYREVSMDHDYADFIIAIDGNEIRNHQDFIRVMDSYKPNDRVTILIERDGRRIEVPMKLETN